MSNETWKQNTVAELIHGPADGAEIILAGDIKIVKTIEVPILVEHYKPIIRLAIYQCDGGTFRFHSNAPTTVKFMYQETRDEKEPVE